MSDLISLTLFCLMWIDFEFDINDSSLALATFLSSEAIPFVMKEFVLNIECSSLVCSSLMALLFDFASLRLS